jgi:hypothetical protein
MDICPLFLLFYLLLRRYVYELSLYNVYRSEYRKTRVNRLFKTFFRFKLRIIVFRTAFPLLTNDEILKRTDKFLFNKDKKKQNNIFILKTHFIEKSATAQKLNRSKRKSLYSEHIRLLLFIEIDKFNG